MRTEITNILQRPRTEITAREIADELGVELKDVAQELNAMLKDGLVEREKRKGNEYTYWLSISTKPTDSVPIFTPQSTLDEVKEVIAEVAQEDAVASAIETIEEPHAAGVPASPETIKPVTFTKLEAAIQHIVEQLPQGVSLGIFSDGSIDLHDGESGNTYLPTPETLRDCLDCFQKLQAYKQAA